MQLLNFHLFCKGGKSATYAVFAPYYFLKISLLFVDSDKSKKCRVQHLPNPSHPHPCGGLKDDGCGDECH